MNGTDMSMIRWCVGLSWMRGRKVKNSRELLGLFHTAASTRSEYSERVLVHIETSTLNAQETNPRIIRSTQLHFIKTCIQLIKFCGNCYCYICYDILWRLAVDEAYSCGCFSWNEDDYNIRRRSSLLMLLLYSGPEGPSTRKMFRLNILECRLQFTVSETTKGKWLQYGDYLTQQTDGTG